MLRSTRRATWRAPSTPRSSTTHAGASCPTPVIELVLDIMQEERVQHELVKQASSLCCMACDMPRGMAYVVGSRVASWEYALSAYMNEVD